MVKRQFPSSQLAQEARPTEDVALTLAESCGGSLYRVIEMPLTFVGCDLRDEAFDRAGLVAVSILVKRR